MLREKSPRVHWPSDLFVWTPPKHAGRGGEDELGSPAMAVDAFAIHFVCRGENRWAVLAEKCRTDCKYSTLLAAAATVLAPSLCVERAHASSPHHRGDAKGAGFSFQRRGRGRKVDGERREERRRGCSARFLGCGLRSSRRPELFGQMMSRGRLDIEVLAGFSPHPGGGRCRGSTIPQSFKSNISEDFFGRFCPLFFHLVPPRRLCSACPFISDGLLLFSSPQICNAEKRMNPPGHLSHQHISSAVSRLRTPRPTGAPSASSPLPRPPPCPQ